MSIESPHELIGKRGPRSLTSDIWQQAPSLLGFEFKEARPFAASGKKPTTPLNYKFDASSRFAVQVQVVASRKFCLHLDLGSAFRRPKPRCARYHAARVLLAIVAPS